MGGSRAVGSGVWVDIINVGKMLDGIDGGFSNQFFKKVGNGLNTSFWMDNWVGDVSLNNRFPRLFHL